MAEDILAASYRLFEILKLNEKMGQQGQTLPWEGWSMGSEGLCLSAEAGGHTHSVAKTQRQLTARDTGRGRELLGRDVAKRELSCKILYL